MMESHTAVRSTLSHNGSGAPVAGCWLACLSVLGGTLGVGLGPAAASAVKTSSEFIRVAQDGWRFETARSRTPFVPFGGVYYDPATYTDKPYPRFLVIGQFDESRTDRQFARIAGIGANLVRITLSTAVFSPEYEAIDESAFRKLDRIIALAREHGLRVVLDLFVEWEGLAPWTQPAEERFTDAKVIRGLEFLYSAFSERYRDEPTVFSYLVADEPMLPWYSVGMGRAWGDWVRRRYQTEAALGQAWDDYPVETESWESIRPAPDESRPGSLRLYDYQRFRVDVAAAFVERLVGAIRRHDKKHLVSLGNIQWTAPLRRTFLGDPKITKPSSYSAYNPARIGRFLSYLHINCYDWWDDRTGDYARALARYSYYPGKPVILGEFSFDAKVVEYTMNSLAGYSCWAFYPLPSEPNLNYLFDEKGNITPHGRSFADTAARLRQSEVVLHRAEDEAVLRVDPLKALTDPASTSDVYEEYMRMSAGGKVIGLEMDRPH